MAPTDIEPGRFALAVESASDEVNPEQFCKFSRLARARMGVFEMSFLSRKNMTLGGYNRKRVEGYIAPILCRSGYRLFRVRHGEAACQSDFVRYIDSVVETCEQPAAPSDA